MSAVRQTRGRGTQSTRAGRRDVSAVPVVGDVAPLSSLSPTMPAMQLVRLSHPALDFWIDVRVRELNGRWLAVADLAGTPDVGVGETAEEALRGALRALGPGLVDDLAEGAQEQMRP